jgi:hypothetical protein
VAALAGASHGLLVDVDAEAGALEPRDEAVLHVEHRAIDEVVDEVAADV